MSFNQFQTYSIVSRSETTNKDDLDNVMAEIRKMDNIGTIDDAKEYLQKTYNIESNTRQFYIGKGFPAIIDEDNQHFSVEFSLNDKRIVYSYGKEI